MTAPAVPPNSWTGACMSKDHRRSGWQRKLVVEHPLINQVSRRVHRVPSVTIVFCLLCGRFWPSRAKYVESLPTLSMRDVRKTDSARVAPRGVLDDD